MTRPKTLFSNLFKFTMTTLVETGWKFLRQYQRAGK